MSAQRKQTSAKASKPARFLRCDLLRPADIILFASPEKEGKWIALGSHRIGTWHAYSHAAIVLNRSFIFEAHDDGLLSRPLAISQAGPGPDKESRVLLHDVSKYKKVTVLRHAALAKRDFYDLEDELLEIVQFYWAMEYPERSALSKAAASSPVGRAFVNLALRLKDKWGQHFSGEKKPELPGPFCSMIAAIALKRLAPRHPLFSPPLDPSEVSPNALATSRRLIPVAGAVVSEVPGFVNNPVLVSQYNAAIIVDASKENSLSKALKSERKFSKGLVKIRRKQQIIGKSIDAVLRGR